MFIFTSLGPFLMHYSKHVVKISALKAGETVVVFIIMPLCAMHGRYNKVPFIAVKYNKLSSIAQHLKVDIANSKSILLISHNRPQDSAGFIVGSSNIILIAMHRTPLISFCTVSHCF